MEQATAPTTRKLNPSAPEPDSFEHAHAVVGAILAGLEQLPFAAEMEEDFPSGWRAHLKFREERAAGLLAFAARVDVPVTQAVITLSVPLAGETLGVHLEALARVQGVEVRGSALVSRGEAARMQGLPSALALSQGMHAVLSPPPAAPAPAVVPVALSESPAAQAPVSEADDVARCARCGCTEDAACEGGCYWVPNAQMIELCSACATVEELQAMTYAPATPAVEGGEA